MGRAPTIVFTGQQRRLGQEFYFLASVFRLVVHNDRYAEGHLSVPYRGKKRNEEY